MRIAVCGAGGFIGGHLVGDLLAEGHEVLAIDRKKADDWEQIHMTADNHYGRDLSHREACKVAVKGCDQVYMLAADMGGMGFIESNKSACMLSVLPSTNMLVAARDEGVSRYFYSSSACVYAADKQTDTDVTALKESDAYPAMAEDGYGWEKLFTERMCRHFREDFHFQTRVARFHNVYGPCFDEATEVLTNQGWKLFADLDQSEMVMSLDPSTGIMEYVRPVAYQSYEYDGPMYRVSAQGVDQLVTPDHKLYLSSRTTGPGDKAAWSPYRLQKASETKWDAARIQFTSHGTWLGLGIPETTLPAAVMSDGRRLHSEKSVDSKLWFEFAGWFISEGSAWATPRNYTVNVSQNPGVKHDRIRAVLQQMGFTAHSNGKNIIVSNKQLWEAVKEFGHGARSKTIPRWMLDAEPALLATLWSSLMAGDGDADGSRYSTASIALADDFQELALRLGKRASITDEGEIFRVNICDLRSSGTRREDRWIEDYKGPVFDVTLERNHILMTRRNGKPSWSGNCGTWMGGREKAPAAICRKVATAKLLGTRDIDIWGDGEQTRSFMFIDDCVKGVKMIMNGDFVDPINLGSAELVSINQLVTIVEDIAGIKLNRHYDLSAPQGVRGRNSDNALIQQEFGWEPFISLREGLEKTYAWVYDQAAGFVVT